MALGKVKTLYSDQRVFLFDGVNNARFESAKGLTVTTNGGDVTVELWNGTGTADPSVDSEWGQLPDDSPITVDNTVVVFVSGLKLRITPTGGATYLFGG